MGLKTKIKNATVTTAVAAGLLHGATFLAYFANDLSHKIAPSQLRTDFQQKVGFPFKGWQSDVEEQTHQIAHLVEVIEKEQREKPFKLNSFRIQSHNYLKNNRFDQISMLFAPGLGGYYLPKVRNIVVRQHQSSRTWHHEIKHAKTFDILEKNPEFRTRWEALSKDERGNSLYIGLEQEVFLTIRGLGWFLDEKKFDTKTNEKLGFVNNYARTNFYEGVASVGEQVESDNHHQIIQWMYGPNRNHRIAEKILLAQEYSIIPKEYTEFLNVTIASERVWANRQGIIVSQVPNYMKVSEEFLKKHPNSIYTAEIRCARGILMDRVSSEEQYTTDDIKKEFFATLNAPFVGMYEYLSTLDKLEFLSRTNSDHQSEMIFSDALKIFYQQIKVGDINTKEKVNSYLREKNIFFPDRHTNRMK